MNSLELIGQQTLALEHERLEHRKTLTVLAGIKSGAIAIERLIVTGNGWSLLPAVVKPEPDEQPQVETATG